MNGHRRAVSACPKSANVLTGDMAARKRLRNVNHFTYVKAAVSISFEYRAGSAAVYTLHRSGGGATRMALLVPLGDRFFMTTEQAHASDGNPLSGLSEIHGLFKVLRQSADPDAVDAIERLVRDAPDYKLCRINVLDLASKTGLDEERVIAAFLHAAQMGLFELSWNVLCPACGGVLNVNATLKTVRRDEYACELCAAGFTPTLDEMVEVTFTVAARVRRMRRTARKHFPFGSTIDRFFGVRASISPRHLSTQWRKLFLIQSNCHPGRRPTCRYLSRRHRWSSLNL